MKKKTIIYLITTIGIMISLFIVFFTIPSTYKSRLRVNTHYIDYFKTSEKITNIVVFSDVHLFFDYQVSDLDNVVNKINSLNPDIVVFNGDLIDFKSYKNNKQNTLIIEKLKQIKPLYGKFAIMGEQDYKNKDVASILTNSDFEIINNKTRNISVNNFKFNIIGFSKEINEKNISKLSDKDLNIGFVHNPSTIKKLSKFKIDVIITGHTLGGQYNLPFYGSVFQDIREIPFYKGFNEVNSTLVYNSNGIGIFQSSMRFLAPSSIENFIIE